MEELQDAIEDAQYMNAMNDDVPKPTKEWVWPTKEELNDYVEKLRSTSPKVFEAEGLCKSGSLGFYMFMRFCKDQGPAAKVLADFIEEVATFRGGSSYTTTSAMAKKIEADYIIPDSTGNSEDPPRKRNPNLVRHLPSYVSGPDSPRSYKSIKNEANLQESQHPVNMHPSENDAAANPPKKPPHWSSFMDFDYAKNAIKVVGAPVQRIMDTLKDVNPFSEGVVKGAPKAPLDVFDEVDEIVFDHLKDSYYEAFKNSPWWTRHFEFMCITERTVVEDDFAIFRVLGRGGFGLVNACKRCTTGKLYAMKMLNKKRVKMKKAEALCLQERNIMAQISSPYVVCLKYAFTSKDDLYLILDLMTGGDLGFHLSKKGRFTVKESKYYTARTILGIAALHERNIVYRDLKPENILMDEDGYTKISDLGLACKVGKSGLTGTCGTRGYWAPEMLRRDANDKRERYFTTVDWFSLGCLIYEFLYGISPFRTERARHWGDFPKIEKADRDKAIDLAIQQMEPDFDDSVFDEEAIDLIRKLLNKDPKQRLGVKGYKEIIAHSWFSSIDWDNISKSRPPSKPARDINTATQSEIGNFDDDKNSKKIVLSDEDQKTYEKWDFISKRSFQEEVVDFYICEEKHGPIKVMNPGSGCCTIS